MFRRLFALAALALLAACSERPHIEFDDPTVRIRIVSDYAAGIETNRAEVVVIDTNGRTIARADRSILRGTPLLDGLEVASFDSVPAGRYTLRGSLKREDGTTLGEASLVVNVEGGSVHTLYILSSCEGVACEEGTACLQGTCVDPECSPADPTKCPPNFFCESDSDCTSEGDSCSAPRCVASVCTSAPIAGRCDETEYCAREEGCAPIDMPEMPAGPDPRCGTVCRVPEEPCRYGYYACSTNEDGATLLVCTPFTTRPTGAPCGNGTVCNEAAECVEAQDGGVDGGMDGGTETMSDAGFPVDMSVDLGRDRDFGVVRDDLGVISRDLGIRDLGVSNPCLPNPCGAGTCTPNDRARIGYLCSCPDGYEPTVLTCVPMTAPDAGLDAAVDASVLSYVSRLISSSGVEGGDPFVYEFSLSSAPTATVRFEFTPRSDDLEASPTFIEFTPTDWSPRTVNFDIVDDTTIEGTEQTFVDYVIVSTDSRIGGITNSIEVRIEDNDFPSYVRVINGVPGLSDNLTIHFGDVARTTASGYPSLTRYATVLADVEATLAVTLEGESTPIVAPFDATLERNGQYTAFVYEDLVVPDGCEGECEPELALQVAFIEDAYNQIPPNTFRMRFGQFVSGVTASMRVTGYLLSASSTPIEILVPHAGTSDDSFAAPDQLNYSVDVDSAAPLEIWSTGIGFNSGHLDIFFVREGTSVRVLNIWDTDLNSSGLYPFSG